MVHATASIPINPYTQQKTIVARDEIILLNPKRDRIGKFIYEATRNGSETTAANSEFLRLQRNCPRADPGQRTTLTPKQPQFLSFNCVCTLSTDKLLKSLGQCYNLLYYFPLLNLHFLFLLVYTTLKVMHVYCITTVL